MIGEQFEYGDEICGAVVSVRAKQERVAIWTKNASNEAAQVFIIFKYHAWHQNWSTLEFYIGFQ